MGVRISWLMFARNSLLAWLADSADDMACLSHFALCSRSSSNRLRSPTIRLNDLDSSPISSLDLISTCWSRSPFETIPSAVASLRTGFVMPSVIFVATNPPKITETRASRMVVFFVLRDACEALANRSSSNFSSSWMNFLKFSLMLSSILLPVPNSSRAATSRRD